MTNSLARFLKVVLGGFLILFGIVGHLVPLLPGSIFIASGILLLADVIPGIQRWIALLERRYPSIQNGLRRVRRPDGSLNLTLVATALVLVSLLFGALVYLTLPWLREIAWP